MATNEPPRWTWTGTNTSGPPGYAVGGGIINVVMPSGCHLGHVVGPELSEYLDGVIVGYCEECQARIVLPRIPGGVVIKRLEALANVLMSISDFSPEERSSQLEWASSELLAVEEELEESKAALETALQLRATVQEMLRGQLSG